jgi:hypothetical protein
MFLGIRACSPRTLKVNLESSRSLKEHIKIPVSTFLNITIKGVYMRP